jgi:undecaprenyl-diphosphatase
MAAQTGATQGGLKKKRRVIGLVGIAGLAGAAAFINIIEDVLTGDSAIGDRFLLERGHQLAVSSDGQWLTPVARILSLCGNYQVLVPLGFLVLLLAWRRVVPWRAALYYAVACGGAGALILFWKYVIHRERPQIVPALEEAPFHSFPSGHSAYALVCYGFLVYLVAYHSRLSLAAKILVGAFALLLTLLIGASRIYLAAHYPSDVAAGLLLGVPWLLLVASRYKRAEDGTATHRRAAI